MVFVFWFFQLFSSHLLLKKTLEEVKGIIQNRHFTARRWEVLILKFGYKGESFPKEYMWLIQGSQNLMPFRFSVDLEEKETLDQVRTAL